MISRPFRFHGYNSLRRVYKTGSIQRTDLMSLRHAPSKKTNYRLAVVVSKKVSKKAVVRNRIRRRIYEAIRRLHNETGQNWSQDIVITVFDEKAATIAATKLQEVIEKLLQKADILSRSR
jgi:ribonuclease P protein component